MRVEGPDNKLDFSWVEDVASAFVQATLHSSAANETFNCTRNNGRRILEAAELVRNKIPATIEILPHDEFYPNRDTLNSSKLREYTDWNPCVDIEEGISRYLNWFLSQDYLDRF